MTIVVTPMLVMEEPEPVVVLIEIEFVPLLAINASERVDVIAAARGGRQAQRGCQQGKDQYKRKNWRFMDTSV